MECKVSPNVEYALNSSERHLTVFATMSGRTRQESLIIIDYYVVEIYKHQYYKANFKCRNLR